MTEAEWLEGRYFPERLLLELHTAWHQRHVGKQPDRRLRLFSCACCRHVEQLVGDSRVKRVIELVERHVDGLATEDEVRVEGDAMERAWDGSIEDASRQAPGVAVWLAAPDPSLHLLEAATYATGRTPGCIMTGGWYGLAMKVAWKCRLAVLFAAAEFEQDRQPVTDAALRTHRALLHDCLGNPFHPSPPLASAVLAWNRGLVLSLAQAIYHERAFDRLPTLAGALEEAGCEDTNILDHCRQPGEHVRGCWVVDLLLGNG